MPPLKLQDIRIGDLLRIGLGLPPCLPHGEVVVVDHDADTAIETGRAEDGMFVRCENGVHFLFGDCDEGDALPGFTREGIS